MSRAGSIEDPRDRREIQRGVRRPLVDADGQSLVLSDGRKVRPLPATAPLAAVVQQTNDLLRLLVERER